MKNKVVKGIVIAAFWILLWQVISMSINQSLIIVSPYNTVKRLFTLLGEAKFYEAVGTSIFHIATGFFTAVLIGSLLAVLARLVPVVYDFLSPLLSILKATPVASFTLIMFFWVKGRHLSILVSFIMVLPMIFFALYEGIGAADKKLLEMAKVFKVPMRKQIKEIYLPAAAPSLVSSASVAVGFAWKSGVAAEVIAISDKSVGGLLYNAKLMLESEDVFAITAAIVIISKLVEILTIKLLKRSERSVV